MPIQIMPQFKLPGQTLSELLEKGRQRKFEQSKFREEQERIKNQFSQHQERMASQFAQQQSLERDRLEEQKNYHQGTLEQNNQLKPLQYALLKAKIEALKNNPKETPDEKRKNDVNAAKEKEENKINALRLKDIEEKGSALKTDMNQAVEASSIMEKNRDLTGNIPALKAWAGYADRDLAALKPILGKMQASLGHDFSSRGSVYGTKLAGNRKPNLRFQEEENLGILDEIHKDYYQRFKQMKDDYERISGKEYPVKWHDYYNKVKVKSPKGQVYIKTPKEAENLIKKYPGSVILGSAYE